MARQVEIFERDIIADGVQRQLSFDPELGSTGAFVSRIIPTETLSDPSIGDDVVKYEFAVSSRGAASASLLNMFHRSIDIPVDTPPGQRIVVSGFFSNVSASGILEVFPRNVRHGILTYDVFWFEGTGATTHNLEVFSIASPDGVVPPPNIPVNLIAGHRFVPRNSDGIRKIYDLFYLTD